MNALLEIMADDDDYEVRYLTGVSMDDYTVTLNWESMGLCYDRKLAPEFTPTAGMQTVVWGSIGRPVRGLAIDSRMIYYRTEDQEKDRHRQWCEENERKDQESYTAAKDSNEEKIANLPMVFQERIRVFRNFSPEWGHKFEGYELFVCEQAVLIAEALKTPEAIRYFHKSSWHEQKAQVPEISGDHSGNTFGSACSLASVFLTEPEQVPNMHGALCPLVGCKDYGCYAARHKEDEVDV